MKSSQKYTAIAAQCNFKSNNKVMIKIIINLTVGISCTNLLSIYLYYQLHVLFAFAATMLILNKDYHKLR